MNYQAFESKFLSKVERNKSCSKLIKQNEKLVKEYLSSDSTNFKSFIEKLNEAILKAKKFKEVENSLRNPLFTDVLNAFRQSDVLVKACENEKKDAAKWLSTMSINPLVCDKKKRIALMFAASYWNLSSVVDSLLKQDLSQLKMADEDGNTALFYAVKVKDNFGKLIKYKTDINYRNNQGDTIFTHICRSNKPKLLPDLFTYHSDVDFGVVNGEGRTAAMYLAYFYNFPELRYLCLNNPFTEKPDLKLDYVNKEGETIVNIVIHKYIECFTENTVPHKYTPFGWDPVTTGSRDCVNYARTINTLIDIGCDFNCTVDDDGNTPLMFFLMVKDYISAYNLLSHCQTMDISICNKYGVNASYLGTMLTPEDFSGLKNAKNYLFIEIDYEKFGSALKNYPTYDCKICNKDDIHIHPYTPPAKLLTIQSSLSEGYFARGNEDAAGLFDKIGKPVMNFQLATPFA